MSRLWVLFAGLVTFTLATIGSVLLYFKPLSDNDSPGMPWPDAIILPIYLIGSVLLHDWLSSSTKSSYKAAAALGLAQAILIVDLLARGERGVVTAAAGIAMLVVTWGSLAAVHGRLTHYE